jgi:hypothetical protein
LRFSCGVEEAILEHPFFIYIMVMPKPFGWDLCEFLCFEKIKKKIIAEPLFFFVAKFCHLVQKIKWRGQQCEGPKGGFPKNPPNSLGF